MRISRISAQSVMLQANVPLALLGLRTGLGGLTVLYMKWKRGHHAEGAWRYAVAAGWALLLVSAVAWAFAARDFGLTVAFLVVMVAVQLLIVERAIPHLRAARKPVRDRERAAPLEAPRPGRVSRAVARTVGALLLAPALGVLSALLFHAVTPPPEINQVMGAVATASIVYGAAMVLVLGVARPWRWMGGLTLAGVAGAAALFLPRILGA
jgi:hypothetical protein